jgi:outer membrane protein assembly factor BamB/PKD repeat protein
MMKGRLAKALAGLILLSMIMITVSLGPIRPNVAAVQASGTDWWPTFHHDSSRTGYSTSPGPVTETVIWRYTAGGYVMASAPAVVDGKVYATYATVGTYCLDAALGTFIWNAYAIGDEYCSPTVANGKVYVVSRGVRNVYCLDASTGASIWSYGTGSGSGGGVTDSCPAVVNGLLYVGANNGKVYCLDASTGTFIWSYATGTLVDSSPAVVNGRVYVGSENDNVYCLNASNGAFIWSYPTGGSVDSSPAVVNGRVYVGSGVSVYCLNASNGAFIWSYPTGGSYFIASPAVAYGEVYELAGDGYVYCLGATSGTLTWDYYIGGLFSSPAVAGGYVYVGESSHHNVYCLGASTGAVIWKYLTNGPVYSSPSVANGMVYVGSNDGYLYCIGQSSYSIQIYAYDKTLGGGVSVPITMDGSPTGQSTPYEFSGLTGSHTFAVPSTDSAHNPFTSWSDGETTTTITVPPADGYYQAYYQAAPPPPLSASASANPTSGTAPLTVQFTGSASGGSSPYSYSWSFGDGGSSSNQNPSHTYQASGTYTATLTVTDSQSNKATSSVTLTVSPPPQSLSAFASASPTSGTAPLTVQFTGSASGGSSPYSYSWTFGDGSSSNLQNPSHVYQSAGSYPATLIVTDSANNMATSSVTITVGLPTYSVTINAHCNTEGVDVKVPITEDGSVTVFDTPYTFTGLAGTHSFTVPDTDPNGHPFAYWDTMNSGENSPTLSDVSSAGTHTAYYAEVPYPPKNVVATSDDQGNKIDLKWDKPDAPSGYTVQLYYIYRDTIPDFTVSWLHPYQIIPATQSTPGTQDSVYDDNIYYYKVVAVFQQGFSQPSTAVGCARLQGIKGVCDVVTLNDFQTRTALDQLDSMFSIQQNFNIPAQYDSKGNLIEFYWVQNIVYVDCSYDRSENAMGGGFQIWDFKHGDSGWQTPQWPIYCYPTLTGLTCNPQWGAYGSTVVLVSVINGNSLVMENNFTSHTFTLSNPQSSDLYVELSPEIVIVGYDNLWPNVDFVNPTKGFVDNSFMMGSAWWQSENVGSIGYNGASCAETSTGLKWDKLLGTFEYNSSYTDGNSQEGFWYKPVFPLVSHQNPTISTSSFSATVDVYATCPIYLGLYDSNGDYSGFNESTGKVDLGIPGVFPVSNESIVITNPTGAYYLTVAGTGDGEFELQVYWQDATGTTVAILDTNSTITENETQAYSIGASANVTLTSILPSESVIFPGSDVQVNATVADLGGPSVTFNVTLYANDTIIGTLNMLNLSGWNSTNVSFIWNTTGLALGNYVLWAYAEPSSGGTGSTYIYGTMQIVANGGPSRGGVPYEN